MKGFLGIMILLLITNKCTGDNLRGTFRLLSSNIDCNKCNNECGEIFDDRFCRRCRRHC